jgi:hypothetical protein
MRAPSGPERGGVPEPEQQAHENSQRENHKNCHVNPTSPYKFHLFIGIFI